MVRTKDHEIQVHSACDVVSAVHQPTIMISLQAMQGQWVTNDFACNIICMQTFYWHLLACRRSVLDFRIRLSQTLQNQIEALESKITASSEVRYMCSQMCTHLQIHWCEWARRLAKRPPRVIENFAFSWL